MSNSALSISTESIIPKATRRSPAVIFIDNISRRAFDIIASLAALILLAPVFAWIALKIRRDSPGPVFYRGPRLGWRGKEFGILKFRTMWEKPDSYAGARVTAQDDPRITPFGRWLRDTKLNELPQFWNVLVGDMSMVGPRPEDPDLAKKWPAEARKLLLEVRPGITSPATVLYRDEETRLHTNTVLDDYLHAIMPSKLRLDMLYVNNRTILTDLDILFWTTVVLLPALKKVTIPENGLYYGPLARFIGRYLTWFLADSLVAFIAICAAGLIWRSTGPLDIGVLPAVLIAFIMALLFSVINSLLGMSEIHWSRAPASDAMILALSTSAGIGILYLLNGRIGSIHKLPSALLVFSGLLAMAGFITIRYRERLMTGFATRWLNFRDHASAVGERILLVGAGQNSQLATWLFAQSKLSRAFSIIGMVDDDPRKQGLRYDGYRVIGMTGDIPSIVEKSDVGILIFTISNIQADDQERILNICRSTHIRLVILPDIIGIFQRRLEHAQSLG